MTNKNDVISRLHGRDPSVLKELWDQYWAPLNAFGNKFFLKSDEIEDIIIETFTALWDRDPDLLKSADHIKSFLYMVVRNKAINLLKSQRLKATRQQEYAGIADYLQLSEESQITTEDYLIFLQPYLEELSPTEKVVLGLAMGGFTNQEIAEQLHKSEQNVRTVKSKAIEKLRIKIQTDLKSGKGPLGLLILVFIELILDKL